MSGHAPGSAVVGTTLATTILSVSAVLLRLYTRLAIVEKAGRDDICISVAAVLTIALTVTMCQQVKYGMGRHEATLTDHEKLQSGIWFWASIWIYYFALCLTKTSILFQYLRVFPNRSFVYSCYALMSIIVAYSIGTAFASIFACTPIERFWNRSIDGTCVNTTAVWFANTSLNIVTDIATTLLPLPILKSLHLPKRQKYALMAVFALGGFTCIISILRLQSLVVVSRTDDISWDNPLAAIWSSTELNVGIMCSCLPTLKGCVTRVFPNLFRSTTAGRSSSNRDVRQQRMEHSLQERKGGIMQSQTYDVQVEGGRSHKTPFPGSKYPYPEDGSSMESNEGTGHRAFAKGGAPWEESEMVGVAYTPSVSRLVWFDWQRSESRYP